MNRIPFIKSVMTPFPSSIDVGATVDQAQNMMAEHGIRHLPVKGGNALVGVITDRDIKRTLDPCLELPAKNELLVKDVMVAEAYVVDLNERLDTVLFHMADHHIGCALVVKEKRIAGIFTTTDACRIFGEYLRSHLPPDNSDEAA